jgi:hypothetical protein
MNTPGTTWPNPAAMNTQFGGAVSKFTSKKTSIDFFRSDEYSNRSYVATATSLIDE